MQNQYIVGIGASAGGLESMLTLFAGLPLMGQLTYIVAQHMAKDGHDELLLLLLSRESRMPVKLAINGIKLEVDTIYIIPSGKDGRVHEQTIHLYPPSAEHLSTPSVNALLISLAESAREKAIAVIVSGTGSDGVLGCQAIRHAGGLVLVQNPSEAKFGGMPSASIEAKIVDRVISVKKIESVFRELIPNLDSLTIPSEPIQPNILDQTESELETIVSLVFKATGIDFSSYKEDTLLRRLDKRKSTLGIDSNSSYLKYISTHSDELNFLQNFFLVSVSSFFRDKEAWIALGKLFSEKRIKLESNKAFRVWVVGCASGEEAYTIAILLKELDSQLSIEILANDLNPEALEIAKAGIYKISSFKEMPESIKDKYFIQTEDKLQLKSEIRDCVHFELSDILNQPLPNDIDLISCRNLLIYMKSNLQESLIQKFNESLVSGGTLFLGQAESLSFVGNSLFMPLDDYNRIFRKRT